MTPAGCSPGNAAPDIVPPEARAADTGAGAPPSNHRNRRSMAPDTVLRNARLAGAGTDTHR